MDEQTLLNRLDFIKANCELNQGEPFTKGMLNIIIETMDSAKEFIQRSNKEESK